ncbi:MAG: MATE family efflux transporter [Flavobacteriales bacterium]
MKKLFQRFTHLVQLTATALKGGEHEYTSGSINKAIFLLAVPMIAEMIMESLFAVVDVYFVSKVSINAVATVGLTESILFIIYSIAVGMSMAVTAIVARRVGEKNFAKASDAAFQAIILALIVGVPLGLTGFIFAGDILNLMGGEQALIEEGVGYAQVMYAGNISIILLFLINAIFRGAGDASIAMRSLWLANGLNIILDPILIFGWGPFPELGVMGAAVATTTGRSLGVCYQLYHLLKGSSVVRVGIQNMVIRLNTILDMLKVASGGIAQFLIESASWIFLVRVVSIFGSEALAGYTIAFRVVVFTLLPSWGMANAASTLVGQNLGAGQPDRAETSVWRTALYNTIFLLSISIVFFLFADEILGLFTQETVAREIGKSALQIICLGYIFFSYGMVIGQAFNGAGDTRTPMWISLVVFWLFQIPLAYWLAVELDMRSNGVFACIALAHSLYAIVAIVLFRRGKWKLMQV